MKYLVAIALALLLFAAPACGKPEPDDSNPALVDTYMWLTCEAMEESYEWMYRRLTDTQKEYSRCMDQAEVSNYPYAELMCVYIEQEFDFRYIHLKSIEKAYRLMCDPRTGEHREAQTIIKY